MRPGSRLHPNHANGQVGEERQHRVPPQTFRHNHLAVDVDAMNLKHRLRQMETDKCCGHCTISLMKSSCPSYGTTVPEYGGRPSHHGAPGSTNGCARRSASRHPTRCSPGWWTRPPTPSRHEMWRVFVMELESAKCLKRRNQ